MHVKSWRKTTSTCAHFYTSKGVFSRPLETQDGSVRQGHRRVGSGMETEVFSLRNTVLFVKTIHVLTENPAIQE